MLQHLWAGPTSNASVDIVQGRYYIEVHSVGVTKCNGAYPLRNKIENMSITTPIDYVLCIGNFLGKDEDIYTFFEPELTKKTKKVSSTVVA
ncbi:hypothetical protein Bca52824_005454 [Brassica carinata]|uniref:Uncharacterized protein n=1 Tax=Brassica carinata TaxID=52824 RepID=A0A8X7WNJ6_BRACI|nr:hypothetical protein Bca52824_005454 [Brassica carinata]